MREPSDPPRNSIQVPPKIVQFRSIMTEIWPNYSRTCGDTPRRRPKTGPGHCFGRRLGVSRFSGACAYRDGCLAQGRAWWVWVRTLVVWVVCPVFRQRAALFSPGNLYLAGVLIKCRPRKCRSWAKHYVKNRKMRKGGSAFGFRVVLRAPFDPP